MRATEKILCLTIGGWLALTAGCGKTEPAASPGSGAEKALRTEKAEPATAPEKLNESATNIAAAATNTARTALDTTMKMADTAAPSSKETAPGAGAAATGATNPGPGAANPPVTGLAGLSQDQMARGLEDALAKGLQQAIARLGHDGGFLSNLNVRIPMPEKLQKVEAAVRALKQDKLADDFVATLNHAAEQAVPEAGSVFAEALKQMTIADARSILTGPPDAATQYFQRTTQTNLYARFYPIVQKATEKTGVTAAYKNFVAKADVTRSLGNFGTALSGSLLDKDASDLDAYVTHQAMNGLFKMVAEEEKQIRQNPVARTTEMLQKVFGAMKP